MPDEPPQEEPPRDHGRTHETDNQDAVRPRCDMRAWSTAAVGARLYILGVTAHEACLSQFFSKPDTRSPVANGLREVTTVTNIRG